VTREQARAECAAQPGSVETYPFGDDTVVYKVAGKMFALIPRTSEPASISLKCDPEWSQVLREAYSAVRPGYHLNKKHWNTIVLDGTVADDEVAELIHHSYRLVIESLPQRIRATLAENTQR
jgi:predicted DNA-binding protein (MmcQ/YjbR family)